MRVLLATVHAMAGDAPAGAIAFDGGRVVAVGTRAEVTARAGAGAAIEDLAGRAVVPGFVDAHQHPSMAALYEGMVHLADARSMADVIARLRAAASRTPPGEWVLGSGYDDSLLAEGRHPTREDLDAACPEHPVFLMHYSFHEASVSSRALALAGIDRRTPDPPGGAIVRDRRGVPTGHLVERAMMGPERMATESRVVGDVEAYFARLAAYERRLFAAGITRVVDAMVVPAFERLYRRAHAEGRLRIPLVMLPGSGQGYLNPPDDRIAQGSRTGEGDDRLRTGPLKLVLDGGNRCAICLTLGRAMATSARTIGAALASLSLAGMRALSTTAPRLRGLELRTGILFYDGDDAARALAARARDAGFGLATHAMGNAAIAQAIALHAAGKPRPPFPARIEHATFLASEQLRPIADAGIAVVAQPSFLGLPVVAEATIPSGLAYVRVRSLLEAGARVAGSSDAPAAPFDVIDAIRAAVTRRIPKGRVLHPEEAIDARAALAMYTREAAFAAGCLDVTGTLEPGKRADLVVLSADPCAPGADLAALRVERTLLAGETVYAREPDVTSASA